jgi:nucleoside-diphosphate-sugar epimerase
VIDSPVSQEPISTEEELEARLSQPTSGVIADLAALDGDLLVLGVAGKMGPTLARMARRALDAAGQRTRRVIGVARFSEAAVRERLGAQGIDTIVCDMADPKQLQALPDAPNVVFMAARKFGSTGNEPLTWAINTYLPGRVAERFRHSRIACFSTGNVYPLAAVSSGGPTERDPVGPIGEYAQSCLGRERMFEHFSAQYGTRGTILRLNYAVELRYGVLADIARKVHAGEAIDLAMGHANVIWQGDASAVALRSLRLAQSPPRILNVTGPEIVSVRWLALRFAALSGKELPSFIGTESSHALLNNASQCHGLFGPPAVTLEQMLLWVAHWVSIGGRNFNKPTKFQVRDGKF